MAAIKLKYLFAYQATKFVANVAFIGVSYACDHQQGARQWHDFTQPIEHLIAFCQKREFEVTVRDCCKAGGYITTAVVTQKKLLNRLGRLFKKTKTKAITYQKANPSATPAQYAATAEGALIAHLCHKSIENCNTKNISLKQFLSQEPFKFTIRTIQRMIDPARKIPVFILREIIEHPLHTAKDTRGTSAIMYYSRMWKDGKLYNVEVLYDKNTNAIRPFCIEATL